jgi:hypothetical protein
MTPRQLYALRKRRIQDMQWTELMFSRLTAATCNFSMAHPETPFSETDFMIHPFTPQPQNGHPAVPEEPPGDAILRLLEKLPPGAAVRV